MLRRALKAVAVSAAALAAGAGLLTIASGTALTLASGTAGAATNISNAIQPIAPFSAGPFDSGQGVDVVISAAAGSAAGFTSGHQLFIFECAAAAGVDPTTTMQCDGNTNYGGGTISVNSDDSVDVVNGSSASGLPYQIFALPDPLIGDGNGGAGATCGLGSPNDCVLDISESGTSDTGMTQPHVFSQVFQVHPDSTDSGTSFPGSGTFGADAAPGPITTANHVTFTQNTTPTPFDINATGYGPPAFTETGALPPGVHLTTTYSTTSSGTTSTGVLSGRPTKNGVFPITLRASNGVGTPTTQSFTLTVNGPPAITSANSASFTQGVSGSFTVTATGTPAPTFSETGPLPSGVTLSSVGLLSGTATTPGSFPITITASNGISPNGTQSFTLTIVSAGFQITTPSPLPPATIGVAYGPVVVQTSGATPGASLKLKKVTSPPKGIKFKGGLFSGIPSTKLTPGTYSVEISAIEKYKTVVGKVKTKHVVTVNKTFSLQVNV